MTLVSLPEKQTRELIKQLVEQELAGESAELEFSFTREKRVYLKTQSKFSEESLEAFKEKVYNETGIKLYIIK